MLWNASALTGYPIKASDGKIGTVSDLMVLDTDWTVRWVVVDTGTWLPGRHVLLPVSALGAPDPEAHHLPVVLTKAEIEQSPDQDTQEPLPEGTLHSLSDVTGNLVEASDGEIGHAEDFLINTEAWQVRYLTVHTSDWWAGEKLLVSPFSIDGMDWARGIIHLNVTRQKVKDGPAYAPAETVDGAYEEQFLTYYGIRGPKR